MEGDNFQNDSMCIYVMWVVEYNPMYLCIYIVCFYVYNDSALAAKNTYVFYTRCRKTQSKSLVNFSPKINKFLEEMIVLFHFE